MAVVVDIDNLDLVVEPHEHTAEDREAFRKAVEERRDRERDARLAERAARLLAQRQTTDARQKRQSQSG
ncbi:MAG: hypothetical protein KY475_12515 [Planctomycetes bacterium]|nr:hypothetical protein [Planctomycetota bacterium]